MPMNFQDFVESRVWCADLADSECEAFEWESGQACGYLYGPDGQWVIESGASIGAPDFYHCLVGNMETRGSLEECERFLYRAHVFPETCGAYTALLCRIRVTHPNKVCQLIARQIGVPLKLQPAVSPVTLETWSRLDPENRADVMYEHANVLTSLAPYPKGMRKVKR